jgi:DNA ligase-1
LTSSQPANLKPMLASPIDLTKIRYPVMVQPKFDGIRALAVNGQALSRTLKPIPNKFVQSLFANYAQIMHGMDGELVVGSLTQYASSGRPIHA